MPSGWFQKKSVPSRPSSKPPTGASGIVEPLKPLKVSAILGEPTILYLKDAADKAKIIEALVESLCAFGGVPDPKGVLSKVLERENGISTTLDTGLSLPHVRLDGLERIVAALAVVPQGLSDSRASDLTIRAVFLFFSPNKQEFFPRHLQLLRAVSSLFQPALIEQLSQASDRAAALALIRKAEG